MERNTQGAPPGPSRRQNGGIHLINRVSGLTVTDSGNGRSGAGSDGGGAGRGTGRRGKTKWHDQGARDGGGGGYNMGGVVAGAGWRGSGRGGWNGGRGRGAFSRGGKGRGKGKAVWRKKPEPRDWAGMPWDALSVVFEKIGAAGVLSVAQAVCRQWWLLAHDPRVWRVVDLNNACLFEYEYLDGDPRQIAIAAVDRSAGLLEELSIGEIGDDDLLLHMCGRADKLRCLRLISCCGITSKALDDATKHFPLLEELEISFCYIDNSTIATIGQNCPSLRCFRLNKRGTDGFLHGEEEDDSGAGILIANNMPKLRELQLLGNSIGNTGIVAILDCCPLLESLDLRCCRNVSLDNNLKKRFEKIKNLKLPEDTMLGHPYHNEMQSYNGVDDSDYDDSFGFGYDEYDDYDMYDMADHYPELHNDDFLGQDYDVFLDNELGLLIALGNLNNAVLDDGIPFPNFASVD